MTRKVWGGRFREETSELVNRFNASLSFDKRLYTQDIEGSVAHCRMLAKQKIIGENEASQIVAALEEIKRELDQGEFPPEEDYEDIHSLIEKVLVDKIGAMYPDLEEKQIANKLREEDIIAENEVIVHREFLFLVVQKKGKKEQNSR